jgi:pyruvate formate lyase activating enzyme
MVRDNFVFNIQRFCLNDGPGIRTLVFLKGCPLHCNWCSNPESQSPVPELMHLSRLCVICGTCIDYCTPRALSMTANGLAIDRERCSVCGDCTEACPTGALEIGGTNYSVEQLIAQVTRDRHFFEMSGGGVTLTGGEPLGHPQFSEAVLISLHHERLHTAVETSGFANWTAFERILPHTDLFLYDLKHLDDDRHIAGTGVSNHRILGNLEMLTAAGATVVVRLPLIPGFNMDSTDILAAARFAEEAGVRDIELMPYHRFGQGKYAALGREYALGGVAPPPEDKVGELAKMIREKTGLEVRVSGG